ncbi:type II toxin-antitoxin system RelE/ParE family toxin [Sphingobium yanoikuyae]|uniref:Addiction module protein n=1 Tax=Sphingobium yanoikuyae TaxID=13690 RepID=A0A291N6C9_SPHYA|nr:type II toxin-antitoxin system RelE/ParE family toxin [Sphingobium yanoikuyae]ATI82893.1 addiction module protein [Sphingobium yanoikuyae]
MKTIRRTDIFADWLKNLRDRAGAARIVARINRLAMGNPGQMRNLKGGVSEMKIDFGPGYRVYFTERNGELIVLLCGGDKKSQDKDIGRAVAMVGELEE